jgi:hypothetical protein
MTSHLRRGTALAALHVAIVSSLGAKLLADRAIRPRVWVRAAPVDPSLPIRGRYVSLRLEMAAGDGLGIDNRIDNPGPGGRPQPQSRRGIPVTLTVRDGRLTAVGLDPAWSGAGSLHASVMDGAEGVVRLEEPVAFFIPEHVPDPSVRTPGEELWVEVSVPRKGAPRPIRLGVKANGVLMPLDLR